MFCCWPGFEAMGCGTSVPVEKSSATIKAELLVNARLNGPPFFTANTLPKIQSRDEALTIQDEMVRLSAAPVTRSKVGPAFPEGLGKKAGWKIGGWPTQGIRGPLFENVLLPSPASMSCSLLNLGTLEAEMGFVLGRDMSADDEAAITGGDLDRIWDITDKVHLVIEACALRCGHPFEWSQVEGVDANFMLADACVNAAVIIGQELFVEQCRAMDLSTVRAHLNVNGESKSTGTGHDVNGNPLNSFRWLVEQGVPGGLKKGDLVITGAFCKLPKYAVGDAITAKFEGLGEVSLKIDA